MKTHLIFRKLSPAAIFFSLSLGILGVLCLQGHAAEGLLKLNASQVSTGMTVKDSPLLMYAEGIALLPIDSASSAVFRDEGKSSAGNIFLTEYMGKKPEDSRTLGQNMRGSREEELPPLEISDSDEFWQNFSAPENQSSAHRKNPSSLSAPDVHETEMGTYSYTGGDSAGATQSGATRVKIPVETAGFKNVVPGKTTINDAVQILGKPTRVEKNGGGEGVDSYEFQTEGFRSVLIHVMDKVVYAVVVDLLAPVPPRELAEQLGLEMIQSVFHPDENGNVIGEIFPEIGVSFGYDPNEESMNVVKILNNNIDTSKLKMHVVQILFQPVAPEPFLFRAESWRNVDPQRCLEDVEEALKLQPDHPQALAMKEELVAAGVTLPPEVPMSPPKPGPQPPTRVAERNSQPPTVEPPPPQKSEPKPVDIVKELGGNAVLPLPPEDITPLPERNLDHEIKIGSIPGNTKTKNVNPAEKLAEVEKLARSGKHTQALEENERLRGEYPDNPILVCCSYALDGDIRMIMVIPDFTKAMSDYREAIRQGTKLLKTPTYPINRAERRMVEKMLINAHLGSAANAAQGNWGNKEVAVQQWLERGKIRAEAFIEKEYEPEGYDAVQLAYRVSVRCAAISAQVGGQMDSKIYADELLKMSVELLKLVKDRQAYQLICYETALALDDVAKVCVQREEYQPCTQYLKRAIAMMEKVMKSTKDPSPNEIFLLGNLYYRMGFIYSLHAEHVSLLRPNGEAAGQEMDYHKSAVYYYEKAIPYLMAAIRQEPFKDQLALGEMTAGMSISYWEIGNHLRSEDLLKAGILCLEHHVMRNPQDREKLLIHYENLCQVLRYLEKPQEEETYAKKLRDLRHS